MTAPRVLIMAGGTGGHVFPALAVAEVLQRAGVEVEWLGTRRGIEARLVPAAGLPLNFIQVSGLRGKGVLALLRAPWLLLRAMIQSWQVLRRLRPDCVLGMGGFAAGPGGVATVLAGTPLLIHEQNAVAGTTNRLLSRIASQVLLGYPIGLGGRKAQYVGNPVRSALLQLPPPRQRWQQRRQQSGSLQLLVLGGSLGAKPLNDMMPRLLSRLKGAQRPQIWHQTGDSHLAQVQHQYRQADIEARVAPFIEDMSAAYAWADLIICRAGALTVAEIMAVGVASILVPLPHAIDDHQTRNAQWLAENDAAVLLPQAAMSVEQLLQTWQQLTAEPEKLLQMAEKAHVLAKPQAATQVANSCLARMKKTDGNKQHG